VGVDPPPPDELFQFEYTFGSPEAMVYHVVAKPLKFKKINRRNIAMFFISDVFIGFDRYYNTNITYVKKNHLSIKKGENIN